jgi:hypothetical protein
MASLAALRQFFDDVGVNTFLRVDEALQLMFIPGHRHVAISLL